MIDKLIKIMPILIPALASILVPVVGWILNSIGFNRKRRQIEYFMQRLELIEKLKTLAEHEGANESNLQFVQNEFNEIFTFLKSTTVTAEKPSTIAPLRLVALRSTFLLYNPHSVKGWVYHILFYFFVYGVFSGILLFGGREGIFISLFYFVLAVVFQRLAAGFAIKAYPPS